MTHEAYHIQQVSSYADLNIQCLCSHGDQFYVGTKEGVLLRYEVSKSQQPQLLRANKYFSKKPILQLAVVPEYDILVALKDGIVTVHDIHQAVTNFPLIHEVRKSKGCYSFSLSVTRTASLTGDTAVYVRMCVVMRRKLQFYYWKNRKFHDLQEDLSLSDTPKSLAWGDDSLCMGTKNEYSLYDVAGGQTVKDLFPTGVNQEPRVTLLQDNRFGLDKEKQTTFISSSGQLNPKGVSWTEVPLAMVHDQPYLIAVLSKTVEIRTDESSPKLLIQTLELPKPRFVARGGPGKIYLASSNVIWTLTMVPVSEQVPQLLRDKQFELACKLATICDKSSADKSKRIQNIQMLMAFDLFCDFKFKESMDLFIELDICPSHVIGLYSGLLPDGFQDQLKYPDTPPVLQGRELENGLSALIEYLTNVRTKLKQPSCPSTLTPEPLVEGVTVITTKKMAFQILDTTLLKCYLQTNDAMVAPLLRLSDNCCNMEETEKVLKKSRNFEELVIFYKTRSLHRKALDLLRSHSADPDSPLSGHSRTVNYLQNLGPNHIEIVLEFSLWVILSSPEDGLTIFTEDLDTVETLPRAQVLNWLLKQADARMLVIPYLEHLIYVWNETDPYFHNSLIIQYKEMIVASNNTDSVSRKKLRRLLENDESFYNSDQVLDQFLDLDCLFEERAILLGRGGRHREALIVYIMILGDLTMARQYCENQKTAGKSQVYQDLVELLVTPSQSTPLPPFVSLSPKCQLPDMESAISILEEHWQDVDIARVVFSLPHSAKLPQLSTCLVAAIQNRVAKKHKLQLIRALERSTNLQLKRDRVLKESRKLELTEESVCAVCGKKFTSSTAFVMRPDGALVHYFCFNPSM